MNGRKRGSMNKEKYAEGREYKKRKKGGFVKGKTKKAKKGKKRRKKKNRWEGKKEGRIYDGGGRNTAYQDVLTLRMRGNEERKSEGKRCWWRLKKI